MNNQTVKYSTMKKLIFLLTFIPVIVNANPVWLGVNISEIYFNESGDWTLEIDSASSISIKYLDSLILECNSGLAKIANFDTTDYIVITNENLANSISFNKGADCIKLYSYSYGEYKVDSIRIGDIADSYLKNIEIGQSIARLDGYGPFYKDNSPTIGFANDLDGSTGKIYGYFYAAGGAPITNKYFFIDEGNCTPILQEQGYAGNIEIDGAGFYCAEITSRSYSISEREIYESATNHELMHFQTVSFEVNENDSININFTQILTSVNSVNQDNILLSSYPNPATDCIYFITSTANKSNTPLKITVYNSVGKTIDAFLMTSEQYQWNCSRLSRGTYIYTLSSENKIIGTNKFQIFK